ncbi:protein split ends-like [Ambystoma mexicanum]|uniref:protein split ends-like n=1 Tax=Ambystoma mexicanum TaxID=8296 RepID=UPI0037E8EA31
MEDRQALRIDYAHGTVPGTAFVIDDPFPVTPCGPRVPSGVGASGGTGLSSTANYSSREDFGLPSRGGWGEPPQQRLSAPRMPELPWGGSRDWTMPAPSTLFRESGLFSGDDGPGRRPNGSYMRRPSHGPGPAGRGGRPSMDMDNDDSSFRGSRGQRPGGYRGRGPPGQRGGPGGRGAGGPGGRGAGRGGGPDDSENTFRRGGPRGQPPQRGGFGRGMRGDAGGPLRESRGRLARGADHEEARDKSRAPAVTLQGKPFTPKPVSKHATPGKILTSQIPPLLKRPPVSKFRNRFPGSDESSTSPSPPPRPRSPAPKSNSSAGKAAPQAADDKDSAAPDAPSKTKVPDAKPVADDGAMKPPPEKTAARTRSPSKTSTSKARSPSKSSSKARSPGKSSSKTRSPGRRSSAGRTRSPGRRSSRTRSSSKSRSRRSRSRSRHRSRHRSRSPHKRRSRSPHKRRSRSPHKKRSRSRSPRPSRSPYRPSAPLPGPSDGFGIRVVGFPIPSSDRNIQDGLYHEFKRYGKIISVDMHGVAEERYALIFYQQEKEREAALVAFKDHCFFGRSVLMERWDPSVPWEMQFQSWDYNASVRDSEGRIDELDARATKILFVGNLEKTLTREDLNTVFSRYGEILGIDLKKMVGLPNRFAFIQYVDIASVCRAIKGMDGELLRNTRLRLGFGRSKPTNCVWVDGLPGTLTETQLTAHFSAHGTVLKLSFDPEKGVALVFFKTIEQAEAALQEARGQTVAGQRIKVDFANSRSQAAFYRFAEPGPNDGIDVEPEPTPTANQALKTSDIEAGDVLRRLLLV